MARIQAGMDHAQRLRLIPVNAGRSAGAILDRRAQRRTQEKIMKTLLIVMAAAAALGAPAWAQGHADRPEGAAAAKPMDMTSMTPEEMHKHCAMVMGGRMQGRPGHDHSADKLGHARKMTPPSEAEMKQMHDRCAAMMADRAKATPPARR